MRGERAGRARLRRAPVLAADAWDVAMADRDRRHRAEGEELARRDEAERPDVTLLRRVGATTTAGSREAPRRGARTRSGAARAASPSARS